MRTADTELHLESLTEEAGYEGMPDGTPAISGDELYVFVRQDGWMLFAEQRGGDPVGCGPERREPEVTDLGNGWWKVSNRSAGCPDRRRLYWGLSTPPQRLSNSEVTTSTGV